MVDRPRMLTDEQQDSLKGATPSHLREFLFWVNPYLTGEEVWPRIQCYGAAFCYYTRSLEGYLTVETAVKRQLQEDPTGFKIAPTILKNCFSETQSPQLGDVAIFYRGKKHIHAGVHVTDTPAGNIVLSKENTGNLPLLDDFEDYLLSIYGANIVKYFTPTLGNHKLEDIFF